MGFAALRKQGQDERPSSLAQMGPNSVCADREGLTHAAGGMDGCEAKVGAQLTKLPKQFLLPSITESDGCYLRICGKLLGKLCGHLSKLVAPANAPFFKDGFCINGSWKGNGGSWVESFLLRAHLAQLGDESQAWPSSRASPQPQSS